MIVRRAGIEQIADVLKLESLCFEAQWTQEQYRYGLERGTLRLMTAEENNELIGYLAYTVIAEEMEILNVAVAPRQRRRGIGQRLLAAVLDEAEGETIAFCFLDVRASNDPAIGLYGKFGFERIGRRKRYYPDNREDALLYRLDLRKTPGDKQGVSI